MTRILIAECMQEISSFNPRPTVFEDFNIQRGTELLGQRGLNSGLGGALAVFDEAGVEIVPAYGARATSAGTLDAAGWDRLSGELLEAVAEAARRGCDAVFFSMHGAMGAESESDPEGALLEATRRIVGEDVPIVASLDLHGILTERMCRHLNGLAIYRTYPHVDFADTGTRAARLLMDLIATPRATAIRRIPVPALVRGDELITRTGFFGGAIREAQQLESSGRALAAGLLIGNPFTDVPELGSQIVWVSDDSTPSCDDEMSDLARRFWEKRHVMQAHLTAPDAAARQAAGVAGRVVFRDAADATSSGASGDSNACIRALRDNGYRGRVLAPIVDAEAAATAHAAGCGARIEVTLGGRIDPERFTPMEVTAEVLSLSLGQTRHETLGRPINGGKTAVLRIDNFTVVVTSRSVALFDRAPFLSQGLDPADFDLVVVKSPHTEPHMFEADAAAVINVDAPGSTSANLPSLGHTVCQRPMFPLDAITDYAPVIRVTERALS